jgi:hypothetical protein
VSFGTNLSTLVRLSMSRAGSIIIFNTTASVVSIIGNLSVGERVVDGPLSCKGPSTIFVAKMLSFAK